MSNVTTYADETLWTESWKKEYKYGVILFVPPEPIRSLVDELRQKYDFDSFKTCIAHISLAMPLKQPLTKRGLLSLREKLAKFKSFTVTYGPVINFLPDAPGVVFKVNEQGSFQKLYKYIESTSKINFHKRKWPFKAHLTIAEFLDTETTIKLTEDLNNTLPKEYLYGEFICDNVSYMVPDQDFCFREVANINLSRS